jgi:hypothetical protein
MELVVTMMKARSVIDDILEEVADLSAKIFVIHREKFCPFLRRNDHQVLFLKMLILTVTFYTDQGTSHYNFINKIKLQHTVGVPSSTCVCVLVCLNLSLHTDSSSLTVSVEGRFGRRFFSVYFTPFQFIVFSIFDRYPV